MMTQRTLREIHREHLGAARGLRCIWKQSLEQDGLTADAEIRDLRIGAISNSHYWLNAATEARRQIDTSQYSNNPNPVMLSDLLPALFRSTATVYRRIEFERHPAGELYYGRLSR